MGLGSRIGFIFTNFLLLIPVFALLATTAVMSAVGAAELDKLGDASTAHKWVTLSTLVLWGLLVGGILFLFTIGLSMMPFLMSMPYIFAFIMTIFCFVNLAIAGVMFYGAASARNSKSTNTVSKTKAEHALIWCGSLMTLSAIFLMAYTAYEIHKYRKGGGLTGDVAVVGEYGGQLAMAMGQPELGVPLQAIGGIAKQNLQPEHVEEYNQRAAQIKQGQQVYQAYQAYQPPPPTQQAYQPQPPTQQAYQTPMPPQSYQPQPQPPTQQSYQPQPPPPTQQSYQPPMPVQQKGTDWVGMAQNLGQFVQQNPELIQQAKNIFV